MTSGEQLASSQHQKGAVSIFPQAGQIINSSIHSPMLASPGTLNYRLTLANTNCDGWISQKH